MDTMNIMISGVGGQGILLTGSVLGDIAFDEGYDVKISAVHGMAQRGGSVVTHMRYGEAVYEPIIEKGQADMLIAFEQLEAMRYLDYLKKDGILVVNDFRINPVSVTLGKSVYPSNVIEDLSKKRRLKVVSALSIAKQTGNAKTANMVMLGAAARELSFTKQQWTAAIEKNVPIHTLEQNLCAFEAGYNG